MTPYENLLHTYGPELAERQMMLEKEGSDLGTELFQKNLQRALEEGDVNGVSAFGWIFKEGVPMVAKAIDAWKAEAMGPKGGRKTALLKYVEKMDSTQVAYITLRATLTAFMGKPTTAVNVSRKIGVDIDTQLRADHLKGEFERAYKGAIAEGLKQRQGDHVKRAYVMAWERRLDVEETGRDAATMVKVGAHLLSLALQATGIGHLQRTAPGRAGVKDISLVLTMAPEFAEKAAAVNSRLADASVVHLPTVVPPSPWNHWIGGGYFTEHTRPLLFVRAPLSVVKSVYSELDLTPVYKAVNLIQETAWAINSQVLDAATEVLSWTRNVVKDYPTIIGEEPPLRPDGIDQDPEVRLAYRKAAFEWHTKNNSLKSRRRRVAAILRQGQKFRDDPAIYFPHNLDFRGRIYAATLLNPQGDDLMKGILRFSEGKPLGKEGAKWLAIHGANCAGVDKVSFEERLQWISAHEEVILRVAHDPLQELFWTDVDSPFCFLAFCIEWAGYKRFGDDFVSHIPVAFDGSCSGLQHFSAMLRDEVGGGAVNLVPGETPEDIYRLVAEKVIQQLKADVGHGTSDEWVDREYGTEENKDTRQVLQLGTATMAERWLTYGIDRKVTKRSVMTLAYGSREYGFSEQLMSDVIRPAVENGKGHFWPTPGERSQMARFLAGHIWVAVSQVVVKAVEAMNWLKSAAALLGSQGLPVRWTTPAGFTVWQEYRKPKTQRVDTVFGSSLIRDFQGTSEDGGSNAIRMNITHRGDDIDTTAQRNGISPNFIHSMDASHLMETVHAASDLGIRSFAMIHDSFGTHAGNSHLLFRAVREQFVRTYTAQDVLGCFKEQVMDQMSEANLGKLLKLDYPQNGSLDVTGVVESQYAFA
ncbi:DNA-dependent RNA polymerase [Pseudomonas sp. HMWF032]|uniref:DNA-directed RNA polymerase n=1 Tax=Pseudomonas sp. HMWF032 TaxID=2056866 RepID=UPI000D36562E|nr:DNA-directed RNA polymerase [Pseudomonas sp. HMWF032]PTS86465.1 DNA-dependent RNA polymerase [Pseudomonas sp. HMWF032]PTT81346.1 DNA-dependent RNA polymerase [Pseudomonas sp. HMWF010]